MKSIGLFINKALGAQLSLTPLLSNSGWFVSLSAL